MNKRVPSSLVLDGPEPAPWSSLASGSKRKLALLVLAFRLCVPGFPGGQSFNGDYDYCHAWSSLMIWGLRGCRHQSQKPNPYYFLPVQSIGFVSVETPKTEVKREC